MGEPLNDDIKSCQAAKVYYFGPKQTACTDVIDN